MEAKIQEEVEKRLAEKSEASAEVQSEEETADVVSESLDQVVEEDVQISNNNGETIETEESLKDRFVKAFQDSVKVKY